MKQQYGKYLKRALEAHGSKFPSRESMSRFKILNEHGEYCKARGMHCWGTSYASSLCPGDMMPMVFILAWKSVSVDQKCARRKTTQKNDDGKIKGYSSKPYWKFVLEDLNQSAPSQQGNLTTAKANSLWKITLHNYYNIKNGKL